MLPKRTIIVVEGPAGAGKSTLINRLVTEKIGQAIDIDIALPRPRSYQGREGLILSLTKDTLATLKMVEERRCSEVLIVDRWSLSQWVYGNIRRKTSPLPYELHRTSVLEAISASTASYLSLTEEFQVRDGVNDPLLHPSPISHFLFILLLPSTGQLLIQRTRSPKGLAAYPYTPESELHFYLSASLALEEPVYRNEYRTLISAYPLPFSDSTTFEEAYQGLLSYLQQFVKKEPRDDA